MARPLPLAQSIQPVSIDDGPIPAPEHLNEAQGKIWKSIVRRLGNDWFPTEVHNLLAAYCQHVCNGRRIAAMIDAHEAEDTIDHFDPLWLTTYDKLLKMLERENRAASSAATRLRITNQSLRLPDDKKPPSTPGDKKPWQA